MAPQKRFNPRPQKRTAVRAAPHPSGGRGEAYSLDFRQFNMFAMQTGREDDPIMVQARHLRLVPSTRTNRRHRRQLLQTRGHLLRYRRTGNRRATVLRGHALLLLAFWRCLHPKTTAAETNAFLWNAHGCFLPTPRLYSSSQITKAEDLLGLSMKVSSTTARQALDPRNILKRRQFWTMPKQNNSMISKIKLLSGSGL
jgi:transposase InsO family protein